MISTGTGRGYLATPPRLTGWSLMSVKEESPGLKNRILTRRMIVTDQGKPAVGYPPL